MRTTTLITVAILMMSAVTVRAHVMPEITVLKNSLRQQTDSIADLRARVNRLEEMMANCCNSGGTSNKMQSGSGTDTQGQYQQNQNNAAYAEATSIGLEHTYPVGTVGPGLNPLRIINLATSGMKFIALNQDSFKITLFNLDYTVFRELTLPSINGVAPTYIYYISETLFDSDDATIEYLAHLGVTGVKVYNEDGSVLWEETACNPGCELGWINVGNNSNPDGIYMAPIVNTEMGTKMIVHCNVPQQMPYYGGGKIKVYGLPGSLMVGQNGLELYDGEAPSQFMLYPNPSGNEATVEYTLPQGMESGEVVISTIMGQEMRRIAVNSNSGRLQLDNTGLQSGTYLYQLRTSAGPIGTKKMVVIR